MRVRLKNSDFRSRALCPDPPRLIVINPSRIISTQPLPQSRCDQASFQDFLFPEAVSALYAILSTLVSIAATHSKFAHESGSGPAINTRIGKAVVGALFPEPPLFGPDRLPTGRILESQWMLAKHSSNERNAAGINCSSVAQSGGGKDNGILLGERKSPDPSKTAGRRSWRR